MVLVPPPIAPHGAPRRRIALVIGSLQGGGAARARILERYGLERLVERTGALLRGLTPRP